jgi:plasmid stability protein
MIRIRNIPDDVYDRLQVEARAKDTTVAELLRERIVARDTRLNQPSGASPST